MLAGKCIRRDFYPDPIVNGWLKQFVRAILCRLLNAAEFVNSWLNILSVFSHLDIGTVVHGCSVE